MIVTTQELFKLAYGHFAVGAYNINNMEQTLGLFQAVSARRRRSSSRSPRAPATMPSQAARGPHPRRRRAVPDAIFAVHLDHGDEAACYDCIDSGFYSSVMIDASGEPFDGNVAPPPHRRAAHARTSASRPSWHVGRRRGARQG